MSLAKFETVVEYRRDRQARERTLWIEEAVSYMIAIGLYAQEEIEQAVDLAENLHHHLVDEDGEMTYSAKEAVDEELTYWGD
ncbi:hypothetical protein psageK4_010c [Pseudomonas phage psageK4]|uniref:Uncharacterized protein n=1 Tax=Pseudomonas phage psageK4 TaxID=2859563 RepID=A0ABX8SPW2_9CAUD|nr:hypothetical protein QGX14_gp010 [Pseudomonas phage psageK4]QXV71664.1 hypothetical protein psageK4_010c [Pseudomonas phage psageK4]